MKMVKAGGFVLNIEQMGAYQIMESRELPEGYRPKFDMYGGAVAATEDEYINAYRVKAWFAGREKPVHLQGDEAREFVAYVESVAPAELLPNSSRHSGEQTGT